MRLGVFESRVCACRRRKSIGRLFRAMPPPPPPQTNSLSDFTPVTRTGRRVRAVFGASRCTTARSPSDGFMLMTVCSCISAQRPLISSGDKIRGVISQYVVGHQNVGNEHTHFAYISCSELITTSYDDSVTASRLASLAATLCTRARR